MIYRCKLRGILDPEGCRVCWSGMSAGERGMHRSRPECVAENCEKIQIKEGE
jgi:hypothetical protein